jgi:hypothetical protein
MKPTPTFTHAALRVARPLAHTFRHGWATCPVGPSDAEILDLGIAGAVSRWEARLSALDDAEQVREVEEAAGDVARLDWLAAHPSRHHSEWRGIAPALDHRSGSGTVRWSVAPTGAVQVEVRERGVEGPPLWTLHISASGAVTGGMTPGAVWPAGDHEKECAERVCRALRVPIAWVTPLPAPPSRPLVVKEQMRRF